MCVSGFPCPELMKSELVEKKNEFCFKVHKKGSKRRTLRRKSRTPPKLLSSQSSVFIGRLWLSLNLKEEIPALMKSARRSLEMGQIPVARQKRFLRDAAGRGGVGASVQNPEQSP